MSSGEGERGREGGEESEPVSLHVMSCHVMSCGSVRPQIDQPLSQCESSQSVEPTAEQSRQAFEAEARKAGEWA